MPALSSERKLSRRLIELFSPTFSPAEFVANICLADSWVKHKFLEVVIEFIDHNAERWYDETYTRGDEDFYRDCARVHEAMNVFRYQ